MATTTTSQPRGNNRRIWIGIVVVIVAIAAGLALFRPPSAASESIQETVPVSRGDIVSTVEGSGSLEAARTIDLAFQSSGQVVAVLVAEGDTVEQGQVLAELDTRDLESQIASAKANIESAKAQFRQKQEGNATTPEIAAAQASVASAEAQLRSAQAQLAALRNPTAADVSNAEYQVTQAEISLQSTRDEQSTNKNSAKLDLDKAVAALTEAQSSYATALQQWQYAQDTGNDPQNPTKVENNKTVDNKLNDTQRQSYYDQFVRAEAQLRSAEQSVEKAQLSYDNARQQEALKIQEAEAKLNDAKAQLNALRNPSKYDLAQRQASIDQNQAALDQAKANLEKLTTTGTSNDLTIQQAAIVQAEESLRQLELQLERATLKAPFGGVVTNVAVEVGELANANSIAISLLERDPLYVELRLSENDVAQVALGQQVSMTVDALPGWAAGGTVAYIAPAGESSNDVVTYKVRVDFPNADQRVKVGMSANLTITTERKQNILLVPSTALLPKGAGRVVQVPDGQGGIREVDVQIGINDGSNVEILSGLNEGDQIIATPGVSTQPRPAGPFGG
ncbi:MAG: efflux RND transporter periplasmic adaptor subunit [Roseiflexaceae bacterium]